MRPSIKNGLLLHWPILAAMCFLPLAVVLRSERLRAVFAVGCFGLLIYQSFLYRRAGTGLRYLSLSLIVIWAGLACVWLGLNVIRYYTYDPFSEHSIFTTVISAQDALLWPIRVLAVLVCVWAPIDVVRFWRRSYL